MTDPIVSGNQPIKVTLEKDKEYYYCRCGRSKSQPYCDGSHAGTSFTPLAYKADKDGDAWFCACKHTGNAPFCDGTHARYTSENIGKPMPEVQHVDAAPAAKATKEEPHVELIHQLAKDGLSKFGHHGPMTSMGVPRYKLPEWEQIQIMVAQMATKPLLDDAAVGTELVIGPNAKKPLTLATPLFVSDMSFGALSEEAKIALASGAEKAGTGICSGEGGMLPEEHAANSRYFYELASAKFGFDLSKVKDVQAFHFKGGQGAKTGTGGHLPGIKNHGKISQVRGIPEGNDAISPATFPDLKTAADFAALANDVRKASGGVPIGFKLSANHIEADIAFALDAGADYIILDGRGGGTGAAPVLFRDHISVPTIPALARARHFLDSQGVRDVTLIVTGGLRVPSDFIKALALGADGIAVSNSAMQAIGCIGARMCNSNMCPSGIATQDPELRKRLNVEVAAERLYNFFTASTHLMQVMARACGHDHLSQFNIDDIATFHKDIAELAGIPYSGVVPH
ncbi:CDGSH iron-sulfur domain-containing protein [Enterovibrio sp. ZSDZ35]|uniref:CDGSH iron-sulfur domain-containing protein n=1 Tax=Enterovibrio qingdaonensis TaxID=2899818 RepID=A0ABT5QJN0_9GAMM|nr:glutamate synthase-related protein [Enterovibrio sp. ZSDZ35]MDD1781195.1 CDGSH iron-sulfur domain-containing protein [Enterovibrio sp. ZSDZ35]